MIGLHKRGEPLGLTGYLRDVIVNAKGSSTPGLLLPLAIDAAANIAFRHAHTLGRFQQETTFSELNLIQGSTASRYLSSSLPFLTTHQLGTSRSLIIVLVLIPKLQT